MTSEPTRNSSTTTVAGASNGDGRTDVLVRCQNVSHEYRRPARAGRFPWRSGGHTPTVRALSDVSLSVTRGEVVGLAGPSGSGKSTLLHLIAGLAVPTAGRIDLVGTAVTGASAGERARLRREHVGFVFQRFHLLPTLSARANVALPLVQLGVPRGERRRRAEALLEQVGLGDRLTHTPGTLSGGEQQRVAIARALVTDPAVVLADEPTGELDSETSERVLSVLTDLSADRAVLIASHDDIALAATDRVLTLRDGRVVTDGG